MIVYRLPQLKFCMQINLSTELTLRQTIYNHYKHNFMYFNWFL